jgi:glucokinase
VSARLRRLCGSTTSWGGAAIRARGRIASGATRSRAPSTFRSGGARGALAILARGGVFLAGGIAPRILPQLAAGPFLTAFSAKGAHAKLMARLPVKVVVNERLGLLGAAKLAAGL